MADQITESLKRIDPIDGEHLVSTWSDSEAKAALFQEIVSTSDAMVVTRQKRRYARRAFVLGATLVGAAVAVVLIGVVPGTETQAYAVRELPNGVIEIENVADIRDVAGLEAQLRDFGIEVEIVTETASPSLVGHAEAYAPGMGDRRLPGLTFGEDGSPDVFRWRIDPELFHDKIMITLLVDAHEGESYVNSISAFTPGEVLGGLHCALGQPVRAEDVAERLRSLGISAIWNLVYPTDDPSITSSERVDGTPDGTVLSGRAVNDSTVEFEVVEDGVDLPKSVRDPVLSDAPCTEEQAARWR